MFKTIREDVQSVLDRDPAARNVLEVMLVLPWLACHLGSSPDSHNLWKAGFKLLARWLSQIARSLTGIEIHPGATIGHNFFIDHGMGVVIGETAEMGDNVTLYHGVTLGGTSLNKANVTQLLKTMLSSARVQRFWAQSPSAQTAALGRTRSLSRNTPPNSVVVGVPGQVVVREGRKHVPTKKPTLNMAVFPTRLVKP